MSPLGKTNVFVCLYTSLLSFSNQGDAPLSSALLIGGAERASGGGTVRAGGLQPRPLRQQLHPSRCQLCTHPPVGQHLHTPPDPLQVCACACACACVRARLCVKLYGERRFYYCHCCFILCRILGKRLTFRETELCKDQPKHFIKGGNSMFILTPLLLP